MSIAIAKREGLKVRESRHLVRSFVSLREQDGVKVDDQSRTARVIIITEGLGNLRDKNYYTAEAISSAAKVFDGQQFYIDHPSEDEEENRPERSIRDLAGYFSDCQVGTTKDEETGETLAACYATLNFSNSEPGRLAQEQVKTALQYQKQFPGKDVYAGISINGGGVSHPGTIRDMAVNMVTEIEEAFSADIVTKPARGGRFLALTREAAASLAAWQKRTRQAGGRITEGRTNGMKTRVGLKPVSIKALRRKLESQALSPKRRRKIEALIRKLEKKAAKEAKRTQTQREAATAFGKKIQQMGEKYSAKQAEAGEVGGEMKDLLLDLNQDIGELSKMLGTGGAAEPGEEEPGVPGEDEDEDEEEAMPSMGMAGEDEDEDEDEAHAAEGEDEDEDEQEAEGRGRAAEGEDEDEDESEGRAAEGEDEDEDESEAGLYAGEDEDEDEDEDEAAPGAGNMRFKCGGCGEVNEVAPPKGYRLVAQEAMRGGGAEMRLVVTRMKRALEAKEGRFVETNLRMRQLREENRQLRATVLGLKRLREAGVMLRKAGIPTSYMKPAELVLQFERAVWPAVIEREKKRLAQEAKWLGRVGGNGARDGRQAAGAPPATGDAAEAFSAGYKESMKHASGRRA